jgi:hypothetical protein
MSVFVQLRHWIKSIVPPRFYGRSIVINSYRVPPFSKAALKILDRSPFDPSSKGSYEYMSGGLIWTDEWPRAATLSTLGGDIFKCLIAYRASITLGEEKPELRFAWEQVKAHAPNWPGLRPERYGEKAKRRLLAAKRIENAFLKEGIPSQNPFNSV